MIAINGSAKYTKKNFRLGEVNDNSSPKKISISSGKSLQLIGRFVLKTLSTCYCYYGKIR